VSSAGGTKAIIAAMAANGGLAVAKFAAFLATGASSMLAESIHSVADTSNQALLLHGGKAARKEASATHTFGYGRERYFWSFVVALVLFTLGGVYAIYEGIEKIRNPHEIDSITIAVVVLSIGIVLEGLSLRTAIRESRPLKGSASWGTFIRKSRNPELPVVLLEDAGALIGLVLALGGIGMAKATGDPVWDGIGTLCIGLLLAVIAIVLVIEMRSLLLGESATKSDVQAITAAIASTPGVEQIISLRTQHLGPEEILVAGKVAFPASMTTAGIADTIDVAEAAARAVVPSARLIFLEPDLFDPDHVATPDRLVSSTKGNH
jgi:cation diffusion facilitator family transporter